MRITTRRDPDTGTVQIVMDMPITTDPDRAADLAWDAVNRELGTAKKAAGTTPPGLRTPISE